MDIIGRGNRGLSGVIFWKGMFSYRLSIYRKFPINLQSRLVFPTETLFLPDVVFGTRGVIPVPSLGAPVIIGTVLLSTNLANDYVRTIITREYLVKAMSVPLQRFSLGITRNSYDLASVW